MSTVRAHNPGLQLFCENSFIGPLNARRRELSNGVRKYTIGIREGTQAFLVPWHCHVQNAPRPLPPTANRYWHSVTVPNPRPPTVSHTVSPTANSSSVLPHCEPHCQLPHCVGGTGARSVGFWQCECRAWPRMGRACYCQPALPPGQARTLGGTVSPHCEPHCQLWQWDPHCEPPLPTFTVSGWQWGPSV